MASALGVSSHTVVKTRCQKVLVLLRKTRSRKVLILLFSVPVSLDKSSVVILSLSQSGQTANILPHATQVTELIAQVM
eukprot:2743448-Heterocapsa_arctica.AAC.1